MTGIKIALLFLGLIVIVLHLAALCWLLRNTNTNTSLALDMNIGIKH